VAEERNAAVLELRTLLLESKSESIVGGGKKAEKNENGRVCALHASTIPLLARMRHSRPPWSSPSKAPPQ
jgi:hypothetical protein